MLELGWKLIQQTPDMHVFLPARQTLLKQLCARNLKEQLSGTGINVRLAKNKSSFEDLILKIERFFISFNPDELIDYQTMISLSI